MKYQDRVYTFAKNLNNKITQSGKQQKEVAIELDLPCSTLNNWTTGKVIPGVKMLSRLAEYFKCSIDDLISEPGENNMKDKIVRELNYMDEAMLERVLTYAMFLNHSDDFLNNKKED